MNLNTELRHEYTAIKNLLCQQVRVELNGQIVQDCVEADDKAGYIVKLTTIGGRVVYDPQSDSLRTERIKGEVRFIDIATGKVIDETDPRYCE